MRPFMHLHRLRRKLCHDRALTNLIQYVAAYMCLLLFRRLSREDFSNVKRPILFDVILQAIVKQRAPSPVCSSSCIEKLQPVM